MHVRRPMPAQFLVNLGKRGGGGKQGRKPLREKNHGPIHEFPPDPGAWGDPLVNKFLGKSGFHHAGPPSRTHSWPIELLGGKGAAGDAAFLCVMKGEAVHAPKLRLGGQGRRTPCTPLLNPPFRLQAQLDCVNVEALEPLEIA